MYLQYILVGFYTKESMILYPPTHWLPTKFTPELRTKEF